MAHEDGQRRESQRLTYTALTDRIRTIDNKVFQSGLPLAPDEARNARNIVRNPSVQRLINHTNRFYPLERLDRVEERVRKDTLTQGGSWTDEQMLTDFYFASLEAARRIDTIREGTVGETFAPSINMLKTLIAERYGWFVGTRYMAELRTNPAALANITRLSQQLLEEPNQAVQGHAPIGLIFAEAVVNAVGVTQNVLARRDTATDATELQTDNNDLTRRVEEFRRYGVKSAIVPGLTDDVNEWLVTDPDTERERVTDEPAQAVYALMPKNVARFIGTRGKFRSSEWERHKIGADTEAAVTYYAYGDVLEPGSTIACAASLSREGELLTNNGMPIKPFLEHNNQDMRGYEDLRAEILSLYSDLVTPAFVAKKLHDMPPPELPSEPATSEPGTERTPRRPSLRPLVLARIKIIDEEHDRIIETLERGDHDTTTRLVVKHPVTGHLRDLASHQKATQQARKRALEEQELELPEYGLTYVKKHKRGTEEDESEGHIARPVRESEPRRRGQKGRKKR